MRFLLPLSLVLAGCASAPSPAAQTAAKDAVRVLDEVCALRAAAQARSAAAATPTP